MKKCMLLIAESMNSTLDHFRPNQTKFSVEQLEDYVALQNAAIIIMERCTTPQKERGNQLISSPQPYALANDNQLQNYKLIF